MPKKTVGTLKEITDAVNKYFPDAPIEDLKKAYEFADRAHRGQLRSSGEPYITHPTQVALILAHLKLDMASIITGLLHDTVEDTDVTLDDIEKEFGSDVALLVDGVTKLSKIKFRTSEEKQAENFRKMFVAMAKDIRVILVKLADRLTNMRTLEFLPAAKQKTIAQETLDIYAPIANRLGISSIKIELEDLCLKYIHPDVYYKLAQRVSKSKKDREKYIDEVCDILSQKLKEYGIEGTISGRAKHFHSIFKKMERRSVDFDQVHDIIAFRITVSNITECYKALGVIHAMYKPVPGRIKDYIAMPKANSYQSLHTTVIGPYGERVEIQIRTEEMHQVAEQGIAAHWSYKEGKFKKSTKKSVEWVNRLLEWQKDLSDPNEFLETVKIDLFVEDVFVFTPKGEVKQLPHGASPLDFAYSVHTDVGHRCIGAKVNGKIVPLKHRLKSGDTIEVLTSPTQSPSKDWLKIVRSSKAKAKIRAFIKQREREQARKIGRELLEKALKPFKINLSRLEKTKEIITVAKKVNRKKDVDLYISIGYGRITVDDVLPHIVPHETLEKHSQTEAETESEESLLKRFIRNAKRKTLKKNSVIVSNQEDVLVRFAKCCSPLPGDTIVGCITRGRGVTIHTANCPKALDMDPERRVDVRWNRDHGQKPQFHHAKIRVLTLDEPGILANMSQMMTQNGVNISTVNIRTTKDKKAICEFDVEVRNTEQLQKVMSGLESQKGVIAVGRKRS